jgi:hypothetical protein
MMLADNETKIDLLNNEAIARTVVALLRERPEEPITIGVHGDWGAGKSSLLEMIDVLLSADQKVQCIKVNGWRLQGFEDTKIALIEAIVTGLVDSQSLLTKADQQVKDILHRIDWLKVAKKAGGLAFAAFTGFPTPGQIEGAVGALEAMLSDPSKLLSKESITTAVTAAKSVLRPESPTNVPTEINEFRKAFDNLLKLAGIDQLVVLIDDLDRCLPDTAIETLEAVRLFLFTSRTAFVVAADEAMIEYAVRKHFPDLPDTTGPRDYARNYLEKLIQVPFRIPALGETETRIYVTLLLIASETGEDDPGFSRLIAAARERLKRPWESAPLDDAVVKTSLGEHATIMASHAVLISDQVGPILASGTRGNPRQVKRFLNTLLLRKHAADARGFTADVTLPVLAKLLLAERFLPRLYDQIARSAASDELGRCKELMILESRVEAASVEADTLSVPTRPASSRRAKGGDDKESSPPATNPESAVLKDWLSSQAVQEWAGISPALAKIDLRPYLFVAKDRRSYFVGTPLASHLQNLVEQLMGTKLAVQALSGAVRAIAPAEASQVFLALRERIIATDAFGTEPSGTAGLAMLVKAHSALQGDLIDLLESLPGDRTGPWVVSGWEGVVTDPIESARLNRLLERWATDAGSTPFLKTAADAALRTRKEPR